MIVIVKVKEMERGGEGSACAPPGTELDAAAFAGGQVGDERQVGRLDDRPAELEDDDEHRVVKELGPQRRVFTADTRDEDERRRQRHQN